MSKPKKLISYVFPVYNEEANIRKVYGTLEKLLAKHTAYAYELIFVNDGSRDTSMDILLGIQKKDVRVVVVNLSRNFGHQIAITAGLDYAAGDSVIIMDCDMQDPPKVSLQLIKKWEAGYDVVYAQRRSRKDTFFKKLTADIYYRFLRRLTDIDIPRNTGDFRLMDRKVVDELKRYNEHNRFLRGMVSFAGFRQTAVQFDRDKRYGGTTKYPFKKMVQFAADGIFSFSSAPLKLISKVGYLTACFSLLGIVYAVGAKLFFPEVVIEGWTFIVTAIFFIGGVQMVMLGVLGGYIGRIYVEVQNRPLYAVSQVHRRAKKR